MPPERNERVIQDFKQRRARQLMLTPMLIAAVVGLTWLVDPLRGSTLPSPTRSAGAPAQSQDHRDASLGGVPNAALVGAAFAVIVGAVIFSFSNWRCPSCNRYLGKSFHPSFCSGCGIPLR